MTGSGPTIKEAGGGAMLGLIHSLSTIWREARADTNITTM